MPSIGIFYGSQTGNTERIAGLIAEQLADLDPKVINIAEANEETVLSYDIIMIGIPTWNIGELQEHWEEFHPKMSGMNWKGKTIAIFGLGDNQGYPDTYQDGMGILAEPILAGGGKVIGFTSTDGYEFTGSRAVIDGKFCGLCLDEDNEAEKTEDRVKNWCAQLRVELGLAKAPEAQSAAAAEPKQEETKAPAQAEAKEEPKPEAPKAEPKKEASQAEAPKAGEERKDEAKKDEAKPAQDVKKDDAPAVAATAKSNEKDEQKEHAQPAAAKPEEKKEEAKPAAAAKPAAKPAAAKAAATAAPKKPAPADLPPPPQLTTRRTFLEWGTAAWVLFFVWLGGIFHMFGRFMFPRVLYEKDPRFRAGKKPDFPEVNKVYELFKESQAVWIVRLLEDGEDHLVAISTVCTHLGCTPNWLDAENKFKCPCHGSGFYKSGVNFEGPAPRPLERYRIFVDAAGDVVVDKARKFREDLAQWGDPDSFVKMS